MDGVIFQTQSHLLVLANTMNSECRKNNRTCSRYQKQFKANGRWSYRVRPIGMYRAWTELKFGTTNFQTKHRATEQLQTAGTMMIKRFPTQKI